MGWVAGTDVEDEATVDGVSLEELAWVEGPEGDCAVTMAEGESVDPDPGEAGWVNVVFV